MNRGRLRVYLGAAPGVGKTYAMLGEGHRRAERGSARGRTALPRRTGGGSGGFGLPWCSAFSADSGDLRDEQIDELDADERTDDSAEAVDAQVSAQHRCGRG